MRKIHLLLLPIISLAFSSCAKNGINFISVGEAIKFAQENFDPHLDDGYNAQYLFKANDSKITDAVVYQKHYFDPTKQEGGYAIDKIYDFDLDANGLEGILYYTRTLSFGSANLLELHSIVQPIVKEFGYFDNGFIKVNNHLGYYIHSDHFNVITGVIGALLELFEDFLGPYIELASLLTGFSADQASFTFHVEFTRFGFLDNLGLKLSVYNAWFDFEGSSIPSWVLGDYISINDINLNLDLKCSYSI